MKLTILNFVVKISHLFFELLYIFLKNLPAYRFKKQPFTKDSASKIVVLANGPSLHEDLIEFQPENNELTYLAVNYFANTKLFNVYKPNHYVIIDSLIFSTTFKDTRVQDKTEELYRVFRDNIHWPINLYLPTDIYKKKDIVNKFSSNPKVTVYSFNTQMSNTFVNIRSLLFRFNLAAPVTNNVASAGIYISILLGFKIIYLTGADHSWTRSIHVNDRNQVCIKDDHFFNPNVEAEPWLKSNGEIFKMSEILLAFSTMFKSYEILRSFADKQGVKIINKTKRSFIDAFER